MRALILAVILAGCGGSGDTQKMKYGNFCGRGYFNISGSPVTVMDFTSCLAPAPGTGLVQLSAGGHGAEFAYQASGDPALAHDCTDGMATWQDPSMLDSAGNPIGFVAIGSAGSCKYTPSVVTADHFTGTFDGTLIGASETGAAITATIHIDASVDAQ